tara:strand:- start:1132 stop:1620 length:489 start_codon:yes stop_codon:yes gene_type:complete
MTDKQRDTGRLITLIILIGILLIGVLSSCSNLLYQGNNVMVTHVLALTEMGDTVKIRIQDIQPQRIYNVVGYDFVRWQDNKFYVPGYDYQYDYRYYNNRWRYHGKANGTYGQITPYPNVNNNAPIIVGSPSGTQSYGGNTTGGAGAPVASNPVTSSGGKKFN